jgi:uncharacterized protein YciI
MRKQKSMDNPRNHNQRFAYFYFNRSEPEQVRQTVQSHVQYWKGANLQGFTGGPFADRTGGLITFMASSEEEATAIIQRDPFVVNDLIDQKWIKEWMLE